MEIERKFLVSFIPPGLAAAPSSKIDQGYLVVGSDGSEVRVRRRDGQCTLTVKHGRGLVRGEVEVELSSAQFDALWPATERRRVSKVRHVLREDGVTIELDVYAGRLEGLIVAEVEFASEADARDFSPPSWFHAEVTADDGYKNRRLAVNGRP